MSVQVMSWVLADAPRDLKPAEMLVAISLANHASSDGGHAYPSVQAVMDETRLSRRAVQSSLRSLTERGVIAVEREATRRLPAMYCFCAFRGANPATLPIEGAQMVRGEAQSVHSGAQILPDRGAEFAPKPSERTVREPSSEPEDIPPSPRRRYQKDFEEFWDAYPRTNGTKVDAYAAWKVLDADDRQAAMAGLAKWLASEHWQNGYVRHAERYLKKRQWEDDPAPKRSRPAGNGHAPDPAMAAWLVLVQAKEAERQGQTVEELPGAVFDALAAIGGWQHVDTSNDFHRRDFLQAYTAVMGAG